jgi:low affinity Fe/Cu permease
MKIDQVNKYLIVASVVFASGGAYALVNQATSELPTMKEAISTNTLTLVKVVTMQEVYKEDILRFHSKLDWLIERNGGG